MVKETNMSTELAATFEKIQGEVVMLHMKWIVFEQVYGNRGNFTVMNESASSFFVFTQIAYLIDMIMALCRLTDPAVQHKYENYSLERLKQLVDSTKYPDLLSKVDKTIQVATAACEQMRLYRDKCIAHADVELSLDPNISLLSKEIVDDIENAIGLTCQVMNEIEGAIDNAETAYDHPILRGDGSDLIRVLAQGNQSNG